MKICIAYKGIFIIKDSGKWDACFFFNGGRIKHSVNQIRLRKYFCIEVSEKVHHLFIDQKF